MFLGVVSFVFWVCFFYFLGFLGGWLWVAEVGVDDLELAGGEEFAGAGVAGGLEFGHEGFVAVDLAGKELTRGGFATVGEIGHS